MIYGMSHVVILAIIIASIAGWFNGGQKLKAVRRDPSLGVQNSNNIFTFLFLDKY
jgi:hypothetical protein